MVLEGVCCAWREQNVWTRREEEIGMVWHKKERGGREKERETVDGRVGGGRVFNSWQKGHTYCRAHTHTGPPGTCRSLGRGQGRRLNPWSRYTGSDCCTWEGKKTRRQERKHLETMTPSLPFQANTEELNAECQNKWGTKKTRCCYHVAMPFSLLAIKSGLTPLLFTQRSPIGYSLCMVWKKSLVHCILYVFFQSLDNLSDCV